MRANYSKSRMKIGLVELPATLNADPFGKKIQDVYSFVRFPPRALPTLHAIALGNGFKHVRSISPETNGYQKLTNEEFSFLSGCDVVGLSAISRTFEQTMALAKLLKQANPNIFLISGGQHPTEDPENTLKFVDAVVRYEGDHTFPEVLERIAEHKEKPNLEGILGVSFKKEGQVNNGAKRPFLTKEQFSDLPFPFFEQETLDNMTNNVITTSRGCPFDCNFCSVIQNFGNQFRFMDVEATADLIDYQVKLAPGKSIFFGDDIFNSEPKRTKAMLEEVVKRKINIPKWVAQIRVEAGYDKELLKLMKEANAYSMFIGLESVNNLTLDLYQKHSSLEKNSKALKNIRDAGLMIHGMFVLGSDADIPETVQQTLAFAQKYCDTAQFFSLTPIIGTPLGRHLDTTGQTLLPETHWRDDALNAVISPLQMTSYELMEGNRSVFKSFYNPLNPRTWARIFRSPRPMSTFAFTLVGAKLVHTISGETKEYRRALKQLHPWQKHFQTAYEAWNKEVIQAALNENSPGKKKEEIASITNSYLTNILGDPALQPMKGTEFEAYTTEYPGKLLRSHQEQFNYFVDFFENSRTQLEARLESLLAEKSEDIISTIKAAAEEYSGEIEIRLKAVQSAVGASVDELFRETRATYKNLVRGIPAHYMGVFEKVKPYQEVIEGFLKQKYVQILQQALIPEKTA